MPRYVTAEASAGARRDGDDTATTTVTIDRGFGCEKLEQRVLRFAPGRSRPRSAELRAEVLFVLAGAGALALAGEEHRLEPEMGAYVAPGERYEIENPGPEELVIVSVLAPEAEEAAEVGRRRVTVRLADQPAFPAGRDREFRYLVDAEAGCRAVTQFVGSIPPGRAKPHYHMYEEVAYVLEGEGVLHMDGEVMPVSAGSCIHFPRLELHILENVGSGPLRVLGVFHPAGDPSEAYNVDVSEEGEER